MNQLVDYILDGDADKLKDRSSDDEEVQELIDGVPKFEVILMIKTTVAIFIGFLVLCLLTTSPQIFLLILWVGKNCHYPRGCRKRKFGRAENKFE